MDMETLNDYVESIAGYVFDNDKLVTYKWLSKELQIHVNVAKQVLWEFWQRHQKKKDIECTYLLIGILKNNGIRVEVVKESNLSKAKEKFNKIISEHLYSIHSPISDIELLANSETGDIKYATIKCDACIERNDEEMHMLRWGTAAKKEVQIVSKPVIKPAMNTKSPESACSIIGQSKTDKKAIDKTSKKATMKRNDIIQKNGLNNFFNKTSKQTNSAEALKLSKIEENKNSIENAVIKKEYIKSELASSPKKIKKGDLDNFFEKDNKQNNAATSSENTYRTREDIISDKQNTGKRETKRELTEQNKKKEIVRGKKRNRNFEANSAIKKRKRIVVQSDSSDSEVQSETEEIKSLPSPEPTPSMKEHASPPRVKYENKKRKVLKLVNKVYKEGDYIVTKKEHVYVSCSEDEVDDKQEKVMLKTERKTETKMDTKAKKQTTLMNFFKKS